MSPDKINVDKYFAMDEVELDGSGSREFTYSFQPDQILAYTDEPLEIGVDIALGGAQGAGLIPLRGQGPASFPGLSPNQRLTLYNLDSVARTVLLIAQRGHLPTAVVAPTSLAKPTSIDYQSITSYAVGMQVGATFNHTHVGANLLILVSTSSDIITARTVTAVSVAGKAATSMGQQVNSAGPGNGPTASIWWVEAVAPGEVQVIVTWAGNASPQIWVLSFSDRVDAANNNSAQGTGIINLDVVGQQTTSRLYALVTLVATPAIETGGATLILANDVVAPATGNRTSRVWERTGVGTPVRFTFAAQATWPKMCVGVELVVL
jgi:hypothetical protein